MLLLAGLSPGRAQTGEVPPARTFKPHDATPAALVLDTPLTDSARVQPLLHAGRVTIHADPEIERLMKDYAGRKHPSKGYRVQVFLGDRKTAEETRRAFLLKYPDTPAYLSWLAPNFRLRVGDLRTRLEAERLLRDLKPMYPGSYIVPDEIEPPRLPGER